MSQKGGFRTFPAPARTVAFAQIAAIRSRSGHGSERIASRWAHWLIRIAAVSIIFRPTSAAKAWCDGGERQATLIRLGKGDGDVAFARGCGIAYECSQESSQETRRGRTKTPRSRRPTITDAFVVSASSSLSELRPLVLKHGDAFGVFDSKGDALASPGGTHGVYYCDTRHLSHFLITLNDRRPMVLNSTLRDDNATLTCDLANPGYARRRRPGSWSTTSSTFGEPDSCGRQAASNGSASTTSTIRRTTCASESCSRPISRICSRCAGSPGGNAAKRMSPRFGPVGRH